MAGDGLSVTIIEGLSGLPAQAWDACADAAGGPRHPFVRHAFLQSLEESGCVNRRAGWTPRHLLARNSAGALVGAMPLYEKTHSYGEYVFDHAWADALHRAGGRYYPKLQTAVPFTPVPGPRLLTGSASVREALAAGAIAVAEQSRASSWHATFTAAQDQACLSGLGCLARTGIQFHWANAGFGSFEDFLSVLSSAKRKTIRRERREALAGRRIRRLQGADITEADWDFFFTCYQETGARKWGSPYLNRAFFSLIGERMGDELILLIAEEAGRPIASALNVLGGDCLYGRYWGRVTDAAFLHFELCYYQAIEIAIERGLPRVEAGAQGEHKLARGYAPVATTSAHWLAHAGLHEAVARYLAMERPSIADEIEMLDAYTPFRKAGQEG
ncbi:MAG: GNAT family N-acetyltransferase [Alphaproteobacteria bacterium]|jgi:predicted N-acyltransferase|nr:GNAT family N-acetyltransferase [Alphaproteobacteria bacterium]